MAETRKLRVDYKLLHELSSADILEQPKKKKPRSAKDFYVVERVITKRTTRQVGNLSCWFIIIVFDFVLKHLNIYIV